MSRYLEKASRKRCPGRPVPHFPKGIRRRAFCKDFRKRLETRTLESDRLRVNLVTSIDCKIEEKGRLCGSVFSRVKRGWRRGREVAARPR